MSTGERRVRRLRARAVGDVPAARAGALIEDALRTATLPGYEGGRVLVIRTLALGAMRPSEGGGAAARALHAPLRAAAVQAVPATAPGAGAALAVYFADPIEPYVALAVRLCVRGAADEWFWRAAVPAWQPGTPRAVMLRRIVGELAGTDGGALAVARLLRAVQGVGALDALLGALGRSDGPVLIAALGSHAMPRADDVADGGSVDRAAALGAADLALLERWAATWGGTDARTGWLAATLLVAARPGRAADPELPAIAAQLGELASARLSAAPGRTDRDGGRATPVDDDALGQGATGTIDGTDRTPSPARRGTGPSRATGPAAPVPRAPYAPAGSAAASDELPARSAEFTDDDPWFGAEPARAASSGNGAGADRDAGPATPATAREAGARPDHGGAAPAIADAATRAPRRGAHDGSWTAPRTARDTSATADPHVASPAGADAAAPRAASPADSAPWLAHPAATAHAGLLFLVPLLARLGMADEIARTPALVERDWPVRTLRTVARRLGVRDDDPVLAALSAPPDPATVDRPAPVDRQRTAVWIRAMRTWTRQHAALTLRALVTRPGRVAVTRTHIDLLLPLAGVDVAIRRAGLDLDPGWVPWLGRVIHFHFLDDPALDGRPMTDGDTTLPGREGTA